MRNLLLAMTLLLGTTACAGGAPGPSDTLRAYADALREGRTRDAWTLLSTQARAGMTFEQFERALRERPEEVRALAEAYGAVVSDDGVTARLELADGEALTLRSEGGRWRLDPAALDFYPQETPRQALLSFARALRRGRWEVLLRLAPTEVRARIEAMAARAAGDGGAAPAATEVLRGAWSGAAANATAQMADHLQQALDRGRPIEVMGERATMTYGPGAQHAARLVREGGRWCVEDPE